MEIARHHDRLRCVPAVRQRHLPQSSHQPDRAVRVRRIPHHRLRGLRETALDTTVQHARPLPAAVRDPADPRHPAGDLRGLHPARLHPPGTVRNHYRPTSRALVRPAME